MSFKFNFELLIFYFVISNYQILLQVPTLFNICLIELKFLKLKSIKYHFVKANADYKSSGLPEPNVELGIYFDQYVEPMTSNQHKEQFEKMYKSLNKRQFDVCDHVITAIKDPNNEKEKLIFLDGPAGSGKTYVNEVKLNIIS